MNERILQLAREADEYAEQTVHYYQGQFDGLTWEGKIKQTRDTKFAQLIVAECMKLNSKELSITAIERLLPLYAEHFGVEL